MYQVVLCTCPNEDVANEIAEHLVTQKLAACVNIIPGIRSIYLWQGKVERDEEVKLVIKCDSIRFSAVEKAILGIHPYDVPEIIALDIAQGHQGYLDWINNTLS